MGVAIKAAMSLGRDAGKSNPDAAVQPVVQPVGGRRKQAGEEGYILIAVLLMVVMVLIMLSIAAPKVAADIQRDREIELMHRGMQYTRAIKLYYKKFGAYPPNMDALVKTNEIRFLRKRYKDPMTGKDDWHLIHFGENKTPTAMGFFGQPMGGVGGATLAGTGPGGAGQSLGSAFPNGGAFGNNGANGNGIGGAGLSDPNAGNTGNAGAGVSGTPTDPSGQGTTGGSSNPGGSSFGSSGPGSSGSGGSGFGGSGFGSSTSGNNNQTFGGGGIIGVESTSPKPTILEYKKKKHFNEWEFVYDPQADRMTISNNAGAIGQPIGDGGNGGVASPSQFGQPPNSSIPPTTQPNTPTPPQQ
jgi:type II secretory pathway pseudopilin PulG